jgi:hypothetical protein
MVKSLNKENTLGIATDLEIDEMEKIFGKLNRISGMQGDYRQTIFVVYFSNRKGFNTNIDPTLLQTVQTLTEGKFNDSTQCLNLCYLFENTSKDHIFPLIIRWEKDQNYVICPLCDTKQEVMQANVYLEDEVEI